MESVLREKRETQNYMKIKVLGISIFEYQPSEKHLVDESLLPAFNPTNHEPLTPSRVSHNPKPVTAEVIGDEIPNQKSLEDLFADSSDSLPTLKSKTNGRRLNIEACLDLYGITDPNELWNHHFKPGSAGMSLRSALGATGYRSGKALKPCVVKPVPLTASQLADRDNLTSAILPRLPNGKLDVEEGLKLLEITDPAELWKRRTKFGSALHLLKQTLGSKNYRRTVIRKLSAQGGKSS